MKMTKDEAFDAISSGTAQYSLFPDDLKGDQDVIKVLLNSDPIQIWLIPDEELVKHPEFCVYAIDGAFDPGMMEELDERLSEDLLDQMNHQDRYLIAEAFSARTQLIQDSLDESPEHFAFTRFKESHPEYGTLLLDHHVGPDGDLSEVITTSDGTPVAILAGKEFYTMDELVAKADVLAAEIEDAEQEHDEEDIGD
jgi:hypothetical protein